MADEQIRERDGNKCSRCGSSSVLHVHHRWMRSAGEDERACNRVALCTGCHFWVHRSPQAAIEQGWLVSRYDDPAAIPVQHSMWPAGPILLEPDGGITIVIPDE